MRYFTPAFLTLALALLMVLFVIVSLIIRMR
jgi:hypothetical protein